MNWKNEYDGADKSNKKRLEKKVNGVAMKPRRGFIISCESCDAKTHAINTDSELVAQRVAIDFHHWKVYKDDTGWKRACPNCVRQFKKEGKFKL